MHPLIPCGDWQRMNVFIVETGPAKLTSNSVLLLPG